MNAAGDAMRKKRTKPHLFRANEIRRIKDERKIGESEGIDLTIRHRHTSVILNIIQNRFGHVAPWLNCTWTKHTPGIFCVGIVILPIKYAHGVRGYMCICPRSSWVYTKGFVKGL